MLRAMRRERSGAALLELLERVRAAIPGVALRTSFIVGFPGETDAAFRHLVDFVREEQFDRVGVFTYSREENTAAFDLAGPGAGRRQTRAGARELMEAQAEISLRKNRGLVGREIEVWSKGRRRRRATRLRARTLAPRRPKSTAMVLLSGEAEPGEIVRARIERAIDL